MDWMVRRVADAVERLEEAMVDEGFPPSVVVMLHPRFYDELAGRAAQQVGLKRAPSDGSLLKISSTIFVRMPDV